MAAIAIDPEQWYADYEAASVKQQYVMLLDVIAQPIAPEVIEDLDLGMLLVMMRDELVNHNQLEQAIGFIQTLQEKQPALYQQEFPFLDNLRVEYYLYKNDRDRAHQALQQFIAHPVEDIDQTLAILDYLKFYDAVDLAIELCRAAYKPTQESQQVVLGTELEFGKVLLQAQMQQAYQQLQAGQSVDWDTFANEVTTYGFDRKPQSLEDLQHHLTHSVESSPEFLNLFKRDRRKALLALSVTFCKDMAEQKQFSFICSGAIWQAVCDFLGGRDLPHKQLAHPDLFFHFTQPQLDKHIAQKIGGFLSMQQVVGVGLLWGLTYVYDWLLAKQVIQPAVQQAAIEITTALKADFMDGFSNLWKYDFVHRWQLPDSITPEAFAVEAQRFAVTLADETPLSDDPGRGTTRLLMEGLEQFLPPSALKALEEMDEEELNSVFSAEAEDEGGDEVDEDIQPTKPRESISNFKPTKPRKSALQLASELPEQAKKKQSSQKKKR